MLGHQVWHQSLGALALVGGEGPRKYEHNQNYLASVQKQISASQFIKVIGRFRLFPAGILAQFLFTSDDLLTHNVR